MTVWAGVVAIVGALITAGGSVWLWRGFSPDNPRYAFDDDNMRFGPQRATGLVNLLHDQRHATALIAFGGAVQLVGTVLALAAVVDA